MFMDYKSGKFLEEINYSLEKIADYFLGITPPKIKEARGELRNLIEEIRDFLVDE